MREREVIEAVRAAYIAHERAETCVPHSTFLTPASWHRDRVIALPAYLGDDQPVAGLKWIASFPNNLTRDLERASAVIIMNSVTTGRPEALIEGSLISAQRTAASAALSVTCMRPSISDATVAVIGAGKINLEIMRFLGVMMRQPLTIRVYDQSGLRAAQWGRRCELLVPGARTCVAESLESAIAKASIVSLATTASTPYICDLSNTAADAVILNISLRDIDPHVIMTSRNVVDDPDHVFREQTSLQRAEELAGTREFVIGTIGDALRRNRSPCPDERVIVSPFGLGVLDLAVARLVLRLAQASNAGLAVSGFLPGHDG